MNTLWRRPGPGEKIAILDRGNVELAYPRDWSVKPDPDGFMTFTDPTDSAKLEVSYLRLPSLPPGAPTLEERLDYALQEAPEASAHGPVAAFERDGTRFVWTDYPYECDDTERGERRPAHGRWLLAANRLFQVLMTYYYWKEDTAWAVSAWERIVETVRLGDGIPLETPRDHWSLRNRDG